MKITSEVTGNPYGMKTNLAFTASGEVNGYTVSYIPTSSMDKFAGMSSARMTIDMGDLGTLAFDQGSGSGLGQLLMIKLQLLQKKSGMVLDGTVGVREWS